MSDERPHLLQGELNVSVLTTDQRVPHISRKTSEIWGTLWFVVRTEVSGTAESVPFVSRLEKLLPA
jgi:hypothetical protein